MTITTTIDKAEAGLIAREPVMAGAVATWLVVQIGAILVGRTHLVTSAEWSPMATALTPIVAGVVLFAMAWLVRRVVTPVGHIAEGAVEWLEARSLPITGVLPVSTAVAVPVMPTLNDSTSSGTPPSTSSSPAGMTVAVTDPVPSATSGVGATNLGSAPAVDASTPIGDAAAAAAQFAPTA